MQVEASAAIEELVDTEVAYSGQAAIEALAFHRAYEAEAPKGPIDFEGDAFNAKITAEAKALGGLSATALEDEYWASTLRWAVAADNAYDEGIDFTSADEATSVRLLDEARAEVGTVPNAEARQRLRDIYADSYEVDFGEALKSTLSPMDGLFVILALVTAFGIAGRGGD